MVSGKDLLQQQAMNVVQELSSLVDRDEDVMEAYLCLLYTSAGPVRTEQAAKKTAETQAVMTEETASQMKSENREQAEGIRISNEAAV